MNKDEVKADFGILSVEELTNVVQELEKKLSEARKALHDKKTVGLRAAIEARKTADANLQKELGDLGYSYSAVARLW